MPLDDVLEEYSKSHDIKYIRYMDDVKVFSKSLDTAQEVLLLMNKTLRDWYLNIQGSKTELLDGEKIGKKIFPPGMDELNVTIEKINEEVQKGKISPAQRKDFEQELKKYLQKISKKRNWGKHDWSLFSRLLTGFRIIESPQLVGKCLKVIEKTPDERINTKIMKYLCIFPSNKGIINGINKFLLSSTEKFDYQVAQLFLLYRYLDEIPKEAFDLMESTVFDNNKNWFNRCAALIAMGSTKIDSEMLKKLKNLYNEESNIDVKRAIALCLVQLDTINFKKFVQNLRGEFDSYLNSIGKYYARILYNKDNSAQKLISTMESKHTHANFYKEHFYMFYLLVKIDKKSIKEDLARILKENNNEIAEGKFKDQIKILYKEVTNIDL